MVGEAEGGTAQAAENIEIGGFGGEREGERGQRGLAVEAGASEAGAGQEVGQGFQAVGRFYGVVGEMSKGGAEAKADSSPLLQSGSK